MLIIQANYSFRGLRTLLNEFPYLQLPGLSAEKLIYSALDWQKKGLKYICEKLIFFYFINKINFFIVIWDYLIFLINCLNFVDIHTFQ